MCRVYEKQISLISNIGFTQFEKYFIYFRKLISLISEKLPVKKTISLVSKIDFTRFNNHIRLICKTHFTANLCNILKCISLTKKYQFQTLKKAVKLE